MSIKSVREVYKNELSMTELASSAKRICEIPRLSDGGAIRLAASAGAYLQTEERELIESALRARMSPAAKQTLLGALERPTMSAARQRELVEQKRKSMQKDSAAVTQAAGDMVKQRDPSVGVLGLLFGAVGVMGMVAAPFVDEREDID